MTLEGAIATLRTVKAGFLPPFLSGEELDDLLAAWHHLYDDPAVEVANQRFIVDPKLYQEAAFARLVSHPIVRQAAEAVIGDFQVAGYSVVATPRNGDAPQRPEALSIHVDHSVYSTVPVPKARDTFVCIWVNFEDQTLENGPFCLLPGTHAWNIGWEFFNHPARKGLKPADMGMHHFCHYNTGPAGSTAVYSGKTWHSGTVNASDTIRKGLVINCVPRHPLDTTLRNYFDLCALPLEQYEALRELIGLEEYLIDHEPELVGMTAEQHAARKQKLSQKLLDYDES